MQIACPWCTYPLIIEDSKVPSRTFLTRCPKCNGGIQLPGSDNPGGTAARHGDPPKRLSSGGNGSPPKTEAAPPTPPPSAAGPPPANGASGPRALVALEDAHAAQAMASVLAKHGYAVESLRDWREQVRLLHQGDYEVVATARSGPVLEKSLTLYKRIDHLSPEARRGTFLVLVGPEFQTGDGTQAFVTAADLVVHPSGLGDVGVLLSRRMEERARVYRAFFDAERRRDRHR